MFVTRKCYLELLTLALGAGRVDEAAALPALGGGALGVVGAIGARQTLGVAAARLVPARLQDRKDVFENKMAVRLSQGCSTAMSS